MLRENIINCWQLDSYWQQLSEQNKSLETADNLEETIVWKGGGNDERWSNPLNWWGERVPQPGERVVFDDRSIGDAVIDCEVTVKSLQISSEYIGTVTSWPSGSLKARKTILIQGGVVNARLQALGDIIIAGGVVNGSLEAGGNVAIASGNIHCYLSTNGDVIIENGDVVWYGGKVKGDVFLSGGKIFLAGCYYFEGDFHRTGGTISGTPSFYFIGNRSQTFNAGADKINLWDFSVLTSQSGSELNLNGEVNVCGCFCNTGTLKVLDGAVLEISAEGSSKYYNMGTIIATSSAKVIRQKLLMAVSESKDVSLPLAIEELAPTLSSAF